MKDNKDLEIIIMTTSQSFFFSLQQSVTRNKLDSNLSHVDEGFDIVAELKTLFNVVVCSIVIRTTLLNFVLKRMQYFQAP